MPKSHIDKKAGEGLYTHEGIVDEIRKEVSESTQMAVAAKYGVSRSLINELLRGSRGIGKTFAEALGLERVTMYRKIA